jgi:TPR repeat protein/uncharacterized RDD family membrane protein YckC
MLRAVLLGVNQYTDSSFRPLKYAIADIEDLRVLLTNPDIGDFSSENITFVADGTDAEMREALDGVLSQATSEDLVFIYFAGHSRTDRRGRLCLAAKNTDSKALVGTSLHWNVVQAMWDNSLAKRIVLILDSCYSGAVGESVRGDVSSKPWEEISGQGRIVISSSRAFEEARELDQFKHGVFAHFLLEGLRTGDADEDKDGFIDIEELYGYVFRQMQSGRFSQVPEKRGSSQGDIRIAKSIRSLQKLKEQQKKTEDARRRLLASYLSGAIPPRVYSKAFSLLAPEQDPGRSDAVLRRVLDDFLQGSLSAATFTESWQQIVTPDFQAEGLAGFELAQQLNTASAWADYLQRYEGTDPDHDVEARKRVAEFGGIVQHVSDGQRRLDVSRTSGALGRLGSPKGRDELNLESEEQAYEAARRQTTAAAWSDFLERYPKSSHRQEALTRLGSLSHSYTGSPTNPVRRGFADFIDNFVVLGLAALFEALHTSYSDILVFEAIALVSLLYIVLIPKTGRTLGHKLVNTRLLTKAFEKMSYARSFGFQLVWLTWVFAWWTASFAAAEVIDSRYWSLIILSFALTGPALGTALFMRATGSRRAPYDFVIGTLALTDQREDARQLRPMEVGALWRFTADLIDGLSLFALGTAPRFIPHFLDLFKAFQRDDPPGTGLEGTVAFLSDPAVFTVFTGVWIAYYAVAFRNFGQTLGSRLFRFRLVNNKDQTAPSWTNILRYAACLEITLVTTVYFTARLLPNSPGTELVVSTIPTWLPTTSVLGVPLLVFVVFNPLIIQKSHRSVYDFLAGSKALSVAGSPSVAESLKCLGNSLRRLARSRTSGASTPLGVAIKGSEGVSGKKRNKVARIAIPTLVLLLIGCGLAFYRARSNADAFSVHDARFDGQPAEDLYGSARRFATGDGVPKDLGRAFDLYRAASDKGLPEAMFALGQTYDFGWGVEKDTQEALKWYRRAADLGSSDGINAVGWAYDEGVGVQQDLAMAMKWYLHAAELGNENGSNNVGAMYKNGRGVDKDFAKAQRWFEASAVQGSIAGQQNLNALSLYLKLDQEIDQVRKKAESGSSAAQNDLGLLIGGGLGLGVDRKESLEWFHKAAQLGSSDAKNNIGVCYYAGWGVDRDYGEALKWFLDAAGSGSADGANNLGQMYRFGRGIPQDYDEAERWFKRALEQKSNPAAGKTARMILDRLELERKTTKG